MTRIIIVSVIFFLVQLSVFAQKDDDLTLFTINGQPTKLSEFQYIYDKTSGANADYSRQSLEEYLELYVKFKLKVQKARSMKLDTVPTLKSELMGYRQQLANSYLIDRQITDKLMREAYERKKQDVDISHIMIAVNQNATPGDTLKALNRIKDIQAQIKNGKSFEEMAATYSDDNTSKENGGRVGYITAVLSNGFYDLETAAYTAPLNQLVGPVRTTLGYHLVKVNNRREARGEMEVAHILVRTGEEWATPEQASKVIKTVEEKLNAGESFEELAKTYSQDRATSNKGGYLGSFGINRYEISFENAAFGLEKDGDISRPFLTSAGWHIVKRISRKEMLPYAQERSRLESIIRNDSRFELANKALVDRIKKEGKFVETLQPFWSFRDTLSAAFLTLAWRAPEISDRDNRVLFQFGSKREVFLADFMDYVQRAARERISLGRQNITPKEVANTLYANFIKEQTLKFEESQLEEKYPEFKALMREYEEGILLFEATKILVWDKASQDTTGLENFFKTVSSKYNWEDRVNVTQYIINSEGLAKAAEIREAAKKMSPKDVLEKFNSGATSLIAAEEALVEKGRNSTLDALNWSAGTLSENELDNVKKTVSFYKIENVVPNSPKTLREARGYVVADYQDYLEKKWVESLMKEYDVKVNKRVLSRLIKS
jgi:peptidyl-prolyl cis-trans isomerase SurA